MEKQVALQATVGRGIDVNSWAALSGHPTVRQPPSTQTVPNVAGGGEIGTPAEPGRMPSTARAVWADQLHHCREVSIVQAAHETEEILWHRTTPASKGWIVSRHKVGSVRLCVQEAEDTDFLPSSNVTNVVRCALPPRPAGRPARCR